MKIGIDISQIAYENTGVSNYLKNMLESLLAIDDKNEYILFFSSLRKSLPELSFLTRKNVKVKKINLPPSALDFIWNKLHVMPIEKFIGKVDVFITSDWTEPPAKAQKATILYDLIVYKYPNETAARIVEVQKRKLKWVKKESNKIFCISQSTKKDAQEILGIDESRLEVIGAGI
jgi:hypothetical protein